MKKRRPDRLRAATTTHAVQILTRLPPPTQRGGLAFLLVLLTLLSPRAASATVDGGSEALLLSFAGKADRYAIIAEVGVHDPECIESGCKLYAVDTRAPGLTRIAVKQLPAYWLKLQALLCQQPNTDSCSKLLGAWMGAAAELKHLLLARYYEVLSAEEKRALENPKLEQVPEGIRMDKVTVPTRRASFSLSAQKKLTVQLEERWTVTGFRALDEQERRCYPSDVPECHREKQWLDGVATERLVCPAPAKQPPVAPDSAGATPNSSGQAPTAPTQARDCAGRTSVVRVNASWRGRAEPYHGSSALVAPGGLIQNFMDLSTQRSIDIQAFTFGTYALTAYPVEGGLLVVGAFVHAAYNNATWFPAVVMATAP